MPTIIEAICTGNRRYKAAEKFSPKGPALHSLGCPQPSAPVLINTWQNDWSPYVTHYIIDATGIYHCMPDNYKCWHLGSPGNSQYIGAEMTEPKEIQYTGGATFIVTDLAAARAHVTACYNNAVWLFAKLCRENGWDPSAIMTHGEITRQKLSNTDHVDPEHLWNGLGLGYSLLTFRRDVANEMGQLSAAPVPVTPAPSSQVYRIRKSWADVASQIGAYTNLDYAKAACKDGYRVYNKDGAVVYSNDSAYTLPRFIRSVQAACGATVDGIAGPETLSKTVTISSTVNRRHPVVEHFQRRLAAMGYTQVGEIDGIAGAKFDAALRAFQADNGCYVDGKATAQKKTWRKILGME